MGRAEREKGSRAERSVASYMRDFGWEAETTRAQAGTRRGDDIATDAPVSIEVKDQAKMDLSGWLRQARENCGGKVAIVWHKKRGVASPGEWYVTMHGYDLMRLLEHVKR
jgi:Holliday junction resolvase